MSGATQLETRRAPGPASRSSGRAAAVECPINNESPRKPAPSSRETDPVAVVDDADQVMRQHFAAVLNDLRNKHASD